MSNKRLLAIDPSLTCSGWALFAVGTEDLVGVGKIRSLKPGIPLARRLDDLQTKIEDLLEQLKLVSNDVLICESQTTMRDPGAAFKVEQVRGIFESVARGRGIEVPGRINPRSVQYELMGLTGRQVKRQQVKLNAVQTVERLYRESLLRIGFNCETAALIRHQDIVDAILVGSLALTRLKTAQLTSTPLAEMFVERARTRRLKYA
ncbi:MAG: hypothetical protein KDD42_06880 [Bdellovibrionales bacterium]|nr:hypothetical protein [Bdellovibrionales bacterium]